MAKMRSAGGNFLVFLALPLLCLLVTPLPALSAEEEDDGSSIITYYPSLNAASALDYSFSYRQSVCDRQLAISNGTVEFRNALKGMQLNVVLSTGVLGGLEADGSIPKGSPKLDVVVMDEIAIRAGFSWRDSYAAVSPDTLNGTAFDDILEWTVNTFDVSAMEWTRTRDRINAGTAFPLGFVDGSIMLVGRQPTSGRSLNLWSFLMPFDVWTWVLIVVTFIVCGLIYMWMELANGNSDRQHLEYQPIETIFFASLTFLGDIKFQPSTNYARLFVISLGIWSLLISSAYTANLASFLTLQSTPSWGIEGVEDAVRLQIPMCTVQSAAPGLLVQEKYPNAKLVFVDGMENGYQAAYDALYAGQCRLVLTSVAQWERDRRNPASNRQCDLAWVGRVFKFLTAGFATRSDSGILCTSLIRDVLNLHLLEMEEDGFIEEATKTLLDSELQENCNAAADPSTTSSQSLSSTTSSDGTSDPSGDTQLTIQNLGGLFISLYSMIGLSILLAIWNKRKSMANERQNRVAERAQQQDAKHYIEGEEEGAPISTTTTLKRNGEDNNYAPTSASTTTSSPILPEMLSIMSDRKLEDMSRELITIKEMIGHLNDKLKGE